MKTWLLTAIVVSLHAAVPEAVGEDLGVKAPTYRPDPDARDQFKDVIRRKQQSGELDLFWKTYRERTIASIKNPAPLGIRTDYGVHVETDPVRFVLPSDYKDQTGKIVAHRGSAVEPLRIHPLQTGLVFIDGRDQAQVDYAIERGRRQLLKIVLTAGSPYELRLKYQSASWLTGSGIPFYFDQRRTIIDSLKRLYGIDVSSVPVVMTQADEGVKLEFGMGGAR